MGEATPVGCVSVTEPWLGQKRVWVLDRFVIVGLLNDRCLGVGARVLEGRVIDCVLRFVGVGDGVHMIEGL